jgi:hypothetical protein
MACRRVFLHSKLWLLVAANVVPGLPILVTPMIEAIRSSNTSVLTRATWHHTPEDSIFIVTTVKTLYLRRDKTDAGKDSFYEELECA